MRMSGLSGNEIYCLDRCGWTPGSIVIGNSVQALGVVGGIASGARTLVGGEIGSLTSLISDGRHAALDRIEAEARDKGAAGLTGVTTELRPMTSMVEFLAIGSAVHKDHGSSGFFSSACTGQELYCHVDAGYAPRHFAMGNVVYALGVGRGLLGAIRQIARGEVKEYSDIYNRTRHLALERIEQDAQKHGSNAVVDIQTKILPFGPGVYEMLMVGTGSHNPVLGNPDVPVTSELSGEELWNLTSMGYAPLKLVLASSVYSLGIVGGIASWFRSLMRGEVNVVTRLIYEARENCLSLVHRDAEACGADEVIGIKVIVNDISPGLIEVLAIGTAIKRVAGVATESEQILPQAIIQDRPTFIDETPTDEDKKKQKISPAANGIVLLLVFMSIIGSLLMVLYFVLQR